MGNSRSTLTDKPFAHNSTLIDGAKVQWLRNIPNQELRKIMDKYDQFFAQHIAQHPKNIPDDAYNYYNSCSQTDTPFELITMNGVRTITLNDKLKYGGSRGSYLIGNDQVVISTVAPHQPYDELMMNHYLELIGVPANKMEPAVIVWTYNDIKYTRAVYIAQSFGSLVKEDGYVLVTENKRYIHRNDQYEYIDLKNKGHTVDLDYVPLNPNDFNQWLSLVEPLVNDIRKIIDNGIMVGGSKCNLIIVGKENKWHSGKENVPYEARAFPFGFSRKEWEKKCIPICQKNEKLDVEYEKQLLDRYISELFVDTVIDDKFAVSISKEWTKVITELVDYYLRKN